MNRHTAQAMRQELQLGPIGELLIASVIAERFTYDQAMLIGRAIRTKAIRAQENTEGAGI